LTALCALLIVWRVYQWSQGMDRFYNIGTSLGILFLFAAVLIGKRRVGLYYALYGAASLRIVGSLTLMLVY